MFDDETLQIYVEEAEEHLADIEKDLLDIEAAGENIDEDLVNKVFRAAHSIKGGAGFMGLDTVKELSHKLENVLGLIRDGEMIPTSNVVNTLLKGFDKLKDLIDNLSQSNEMDIDEQIVALVGLTTASLEPEEKKTVTTNIDINLPDGRIIFTVPEFDLTQARKGGKFVYLAEYDLMKVHEAGKTPLDIIKLITQSGILIESVVDVMAVGTLDDDASMRMPFMVLHASIIEADIIADVLDLEEQYIKILTEDGKLTALDGTEIENALTKSEGEVKQEPEPEKKQEPEKQEKTPPPPKQEEAVKKPVAEPKPAPKKAVQDKKPSEPSFQKESSLRVNVSLLDSLMNLAGELVLSRNQLLQSISAQDWQSMDLAKQRIDMVTSELQEAIMLTRMQPIGKIFNKFPRVVRDLAQTLGKEVKLELEGKEVELDKSILEGLNDPLTHMIRNSVDHGIETPDIRKNAGKKPVGILLLRSYHEAGQIIIEIVDDGKGINGEALAEKAMSKSLLTEEQVEAMSEKDKINLIFMPGFSTAEKVSDVSGRGVGMDVVKSNLDALGGVVDIQSVVGEGTTVKIKLPLTLAIIPSLLVSVGKERFAIPQVNLDELLRIPASQIGSRIEVVGDAKVVRLRDALLPVLSLSEVIGVETIPEEKKHAVNIAVVSAGPFKYGLIVDGLHDSEEIVVKPLGRHLSHCSEYAGATILGDGRVALILDIANLAAKASLTSAESAENTEEVELTEAKHTTDLESFLLFRTAPKEQFAVPLGLVARIDRIKPDEIEKLGQRSVFQFHGESIPLFSMNEVAQVKPMEDSKSYIVIIFLISGKEFGLLASGPLDSVEINVDVDDRIFKQPGILGSMVINKNTTLIVDIYGFIKTVQPQWMEVDDIKDESDTILLAEDAAFFRNQVKQLLENEGYRVLLAEDGQIGWNMLEEHHEEISILLTDIEMPNMNGFELTRKVRADSRFKDLPVIAITSLADEKNKAEGIKAGVDDYQTKLDREKLLASIEMALKKN